MNKQAKEIVDNYKDAVFQWERYYQIALQKYIGLALAGKACAEAALFADNALIQRYNHVYGNKEHAKQLGFKEH